MNILLVLATRPDVIKMAPVFAALRRRGVRARVVLTSQHRDLVRPFLRWFRIPVHHDLRVMKYAQTPSQVAAGVLNRLPAVLKRERPDRVVVQGDTTSALAAALAAFYLQIPVAHVEAGLRTGDRQRPFPEEANRKLISALASLHFAPTPNARKNLLAEGVEPSAIHVTGNTVVDALYSVLRRGACLPQSSPRRPFVLITCHRRESHGAGLANVSRALRRLAIRHPGVDFRICLHPNPAVRYPLQRSLAALPNIQLLSPQPYPRFVRLMSRALFLVSDSGGVQEEAPALGKPVLVLRERTERPEALKAAVAKLVGTQTETLVREISRLIEQPAARRAMSRARSLFGDGRAAERIAAILLREKRRGCSL